jgi:hypothetical protein
MVPEISIPRLYFTIMEALVKMACDRIVVLEHQFAHYYAVAKCHFEGSEF